MSSASLNVASASICVTATCASSSGYYSAICSVKAITNPPNLSRQGANLVAPLVPTANVLLFFIIFPLFITCTIFPSLTFSLALLLSLLYSRPSLLSSLPALYLSSFHPWSQP
ncbi:hypothetical protein M440DRAFT_142082 [Trichoderma longibrachiatum ATCC 18648]|uniref:Uncharacterized protein n=1 Tax=Trichoderma longibrachiatum ATCC 18648 TaxID=983965 RepID=A0A2T4BUY2_TRILO|nr:hypothetical protein M440DRAFT_142082 [Trichoderma longibrachiatum ATCC 18648]